MAKETRTRTPTRRRGRPSLHEEAWSKVSVVLFDRQISRLDGITSSLRHEAKRPVSRATLIRALIEALLQSRVDLTNAKNEADLTATLLKRLRRRQRDGI
jgi:hypothetical protein